jgi:hypothetical protein
MSSVVGPMTIVRQPTRLCVLSSGYLGSDQIIFEIFSVGRKGGSGYGGKERLYKSVAESEPRASGKYPVILVAIHFWAVCVVYSLT